MKVPSTNPYGELIQECRNLLEGSIKGLYTLPVTNYRLTRPPNSSFGDIATSICFELSKEMNQPPMTLAEQIVENLRLSSEGLIDRVQAVDGYINFYANYPNLSELTLRSANILDDTYGYVKISEPMKIIVEHTSVNPVGPIHVGSARNSLLGDSLCRILQARGHDVSANFYINDMGRQIAVLVYGYTLVNHIPSDRKIDQWLGLVYAITSCMIEIQSLKRKLASQQITNEDATRIQKELKDWISAAEDLRERDEALFRELSHQITQSSQDPELLIAHILRQYEQEEEKTKKLVRTVVAKCLRGFEETYERLNVSWNSWDWESELVWNSSVTNIIENLENTSYCKREDGALEFDVDKLAQDKRLKKLLGIPSEHEIPSLVLTRSDGTTLYPTRDIAYSLWKIDRADKVINVIGKEQTLAQTQIQVALSLLTTQQRAMNQIHYAYELVRISGYRMSKRRGRYVTLDEILDEAEKRARNEVEKRSPELPSEIKQTISQVVGNGAVKYALLCISPTKPVIFSWDRALNFEMNSAPFIQYAYARASNILKKAQGTLNEVTHFSLLVKEIEHELVKKIAQFPEVFINAAERLSPNTISEFVNDLAACFNSFYASTPVLQAETSELIAVRLALVNAVKITIRNSLAFLGIKVLDRM